MNSLFFVALAAVVVGGVVGYLIRKFQVKGKVGSAEAKAEKLLEGAKQKEKETVFQAKEQALKITEEAKKQENEIRSQLLQSQKRLEKRENDLDERAKVVERRKEALDQKQEEIKKLREDLVANKEKQLENLEKIAKLTRDEAKQVLLDQVESEVEDDLVILTKKLVEEARETAEKKARSIVAEAIERTSAEVSTETTTTTVDLPNEDMKGRIIGKEGRNIKAFENLLGVELIVDETPDTVVITGYNSVRRHVAKVTLERLIKDGRIHPASVEEAYEKAKKEVGQMIKEAGEEAVYELGITNFPPKLVQLIGRLKFRSSYGQNVLKHSIEMAKIGAIIAEDLGANISVVKQGALLHDVGKALDQDMEGSHVEIGKQIAQKFGLSEELINCIESHHGDVEHMTVEAAIVDACDNISGARPGARRDTYEQYVKRLEELENLANSYDGVKKSYAIQAGREIRVFVEPTQVDDWGAMDMARKISSQIEQQLTYPGEIKVQVIRDSRVIEYAK